MKINDVLEAINVAIDEERKNQDISAKGHFIATTEIKKSMGPYKQCYINIIYVNLDKNINVPFVRASFMERVLVDKVDLLIGSTEKIAVTKFTLATHEGDIWNKIIQGNYGIN